MIRRRRRLPIGWSWRNPSTTIDDNSVILLHPDTMHTLNFFHGDTVLIKGKKRRDTRFALFLMTLLVTVPRFLWTRWCMWSNFRVRLGDVISIHHCHGINYGNKVHAFFLLMTPLKALLGVSLMPTWSLILWTRIGRWGKVIFLLWGVGWGV